MSSPDVIVVGAGVLGLCTAAELAARGHAVTVIDPGAANASAVAAGMIAPAMESVLEAASPERAALLKRARGLWSAFAARHGLSLIEDGARWRGPEAAAVVADLQALGFRAELRDGDAFTPDDARIEPVEALQRLSALIEIVQGEVKDARREGARWRVGGAFGERMSSVLVLATGAGRAVPGLPVEVSRRIAAVQPIRGQIAQLATPVEGVVRSDDGYIVPSGAGALAGATMEAGRHDLDPDPAITKAQAAVATRLLGRPCAVVEPRVGIRGATVDGLPLAGPSGAPGLHMALAPRRNGWLLGPLVAQVVADGIEGGTPHADAAALNPQRFG